LLTPVFVFSAQTQPADKNADVTVNKETKNLYIAGKNVLINNIVKGDLVAAGQNIDIDNIVNQSLIAIGQKVNIGKNIKQNAKILAADTVFSGSVGQDLIIAGQNINLLEGSSVLEDLIIAGQNITIDTSVGGLTTIYGDKVVLGGKYLQSVKVKAKTSLTVSDNTMVSGTLNYSAPQEATISSSAQIAKTEFTKIAASGSFFSDFQKSRLISKVLSPIALIIAGLVLIYLIPKKSLSFVKLSVEGFWKNLGIGLLALFLPVIAFFILLVTFVGGWLASILILLYILLLVLSSIYGSIILGSFITKLINKEKEYSVGWKEVVIGGILMGILRFIPGIGSLVLFIFMILALGAILIQMGQGIKSEHAK
jgi:hypothetical protein